MRSRVALAGPGLTVFGILAVSFLSLGLAHFIGLAYFPRTDPGQFVINMKAPTGTRIEMTDKEIAKVETIVRKIVAPEDLRLIVSNLGTVAGFSALYTSNSGGHTATVQVGLKAEHRTGSYEYMARLREASQLLTDFGKASAKATAGSAKADAASVRAQVLLQVDLAYFALLESKAVQKVADETVRERQFILSQVAALAEGNFKSQLDVSFARVDVGQAKLPQLQAQNRVSESSARLAEALGYQDQLPVQPVDATPFDAPAPNLTALIKRAFELKREL